MLFIRFTSIYSYIKFPFSLLQGTVLLLCGEYHIHRVCVPLPFLCRLSSRSASQHYETAISITLHFAVRVGECCGAKVNPPIEERTVKMKQYFAAIGGAMPLVMIGVFLRPKSTGTSPIIAQFTGAFLAGLFEPWIGPLAKTTRPKEEVCLLWLNFPSPLE